MQPQHADREPEHQSFAGLLSALTAAKAHVAPSQPSTAWTDNLQEDVATLTYERAMQKHARYKSAGGATAPDTSAQFSMDGAPHMAIPTMPASATGATHKSAIPAREKQEHARKTASVTLRMSQVEFTKLHERAAEANLTVSAYLRSCTFEAEALRTQVKQALAELRNQPATAPPSSHAGSKWLRLLRR